MKDYYSILGVRKNASAVEIKRTYRKLAFAFHPDKNPDPRAEVIFKEINEAYDTLGDLEKRRQYDDLLSNPLKDVFEEDAIPKHRDPAYRRQRPPTATKSSYQRRVELMATYMPHCRVIFFFSLAVCALLFIDRLLPLRREISIVADNHFVIGKRGRNLITVVLLENGRRVRLNEFDAFNFPVGEPATIYFSRILNIKVKAEAPYNQMFRVPMTIYGNFVFAPILLLIFSSAGLIFKNVERIFNMGISSLFVLLLCGLFIWIGS